MKNRFKEKIVYVRIIITQEYREAYVMRGLNCLHYYGINTANRLARLQTLQRALVKS